MVDVGPKNDQVRVARAIGFITLNPETLELINLNHVKKGDELTVAEIAGIQAAKETPMLIPLCHTLMLTKVEVMASVTKKELA